MKKVAFLLIGAALACSCTNDGRPGNAIETELSTTTILGEFNVEYGQTMYTTVYVYVDGSPYQLEAEPDAIFKGFEDVSRMELNGRRALVAGDVVEGVYRATYAELLPVVVPELDSVVQEILARRKTLETELRELDRERMRLMEEDLLNRVNQPDSERPSDESKEAVMSIESQMDAVVAQIELIDREVSEITQAQ